MSDNVEFVDEMSHLGATLLNVQKFEFVFFGLAAHVPNSNNKDWNGEDFLRGNQGKFKETLGRLKKAYAGKFLLDNSDLDRLVRDRNILCHNYYRMVHADIKGSQKIENPVKFLTELSTLSNRYTSALLGFIALYNNQSEYPEFSDAQVRDIAIFNEVADLTLLEREIDKLTAEALVASKNNKTLEFIGEKKLARLFELLQLHPSKQYTQILQGEDLNSDLIDGIKLLKKQLETGL